MPEPNAKQSNESRLASIESRQDRLLNELDLLNERIEAALGGVAGGRVDEAQ